MCSSVISSGVIVGAGGGDSVGAGVVGEGAAVGSEVGEAVSGEGVAVTGSEVEVVGEGEAVAAGALSSGEPPQAAKATARHASATARRRGMPNSVEGAAQSLAYGDLTKPARLP